MTTQTLTTPPATNAGLQTPAPSQHAPRNTFGGVVKSEWIKLMSLRSIRFTLILTFLAGAGIMTLGAIVMNQFADEMMGQGGELTYLLQILQPPIMFLGLLFGVLGVFAISSEYSSGMILSTLAATPKRSRVFTAKLLVITLVSLATAIITIGVGLLVGLIFQPEAAEALSEPQFLSAVGGSLIFLLAMTLMSFGVAGILRSTAGGIAVVAGLTFVLPIAFAFASMAEKAWIDWILNHLPLTLGNFLSMGITEIPDGWEGEMLTWGESAISVGIWALVFLVPAFFLFLKRDAK